MVIASQLSSGITQTRLDSLVDDILIQILSLLPAWDVIHLRQTSKRMESLSRVSAVWRALFSRDVLTSGRPIPGFSFAPTPRLVQLCARDAFEDLDAGFLYDEKHGLARELIEASDLETRTLHALRLDKSWATSISSAISPFVPGIDSNANESRLRTFQTPSPVRDIVLLPGGRFVVSLHADRIRCWDLGVPRALNSTTTTKSPISSVKCAGEMLLPRGLAEASMCMNTRPTLPSISVYGHHSVFNAFFALCPDTPPTPSLDDTVSVLGSVSNSEGHNNNRKRTCEILSVCLDPVRSSSTFDLHGSASRTASVSGSPFASPVPFFRYETTVYLPEVLITPSYPEGSVSAQTMVGPQWGPQRFSRGKLGKMLLMYGSNIFFESFVPPVPADGNENGVSGDPRYVGIEVVDCSEPTNSVLFEYPDPQVGPYVGMHVYTPAKQVVIVWQNCAALYPLPFRDSVVSSSPSPSLSLSLSGSALPSRLSSTPPSSSFRASRPETSSFSHLSSPLSSPSRLPSPSPGSSRSNVDGMGSELDTQQHDALVSSSQTDAVEDVKIDAYIEADPREPGQPEPRRTVTMPTIIFALSEPVEAPIAFSLCSGSDIDIHEHGDTTRRYPTTSEGAPLHPLTILARSRMNPTKNVQSVLTASLNPYPENDDEKFVFRLSRVPVSPSVPPALPNPNPSAGGPESNVIVALALGRSGRGIRADADGALYRCSRAEVVLPRAGLYVSFGGGEAGAPGASAVPTVDSWPWRCAAVLPSQLPPSPSSRTSEGVQDQEENLVLRFDDGMGRVVAARVPQATSSMVGVAGKGTSEVTVLDFA